MGVSTTLALANRGVRVLAMDKHSIPNTMGSSHGHSRAIRMGYYEHPDYVPLLRRAYDLWHQWEAASECQLLHMTSGLYMGAADSDLVSGSIRAAREHGLQHEVLSRDEIALRYPQFNLPDDFVAMHEAAAGLLLPELAISTAASRAERAGAELHANEPVIEWKVGSDGVEVRTTTCTYEAEKIVICGGAWSVRLLQNLDVCLKVTRQVVGWVEPVRPERFALGTFPTWALSAPDGNLYYGFPMLADNRGLKLGHHWHAQTTDADTVVREALPGDEDDFRPALTRFLPGADGPLKSIGVCLYTNSPDSHFIIDKHPEHDRVTFACGFSGHGFKFMPVIGEILADLALNGRTDLPIDFLRISRLQRPPSLSLASPSERRGRG